MLEKRGRYSLRQAKQGFMASCGHQVEAGAPVLIDYNARKIYCTTCGPSRLGEALQVLWREMALS